MELERALSNLPGYTHQRIQGRYFRLLRDA